VQRVPRTSRTRRAPSHGSAAPRARAAVAAIAASAASAIGAAGSEAGGAEEKARISLRYSAPEGCPAAADVVKEVDRLLGGRAAPSAAPIEVSARVSQEDGGGYRLRLEATRGGTPRVRELRGPTCAAVTDAAAVILALMIDPSAVASAPEEAPKMPQGEAPKAAQSEPTKTAQVEAPRTAPGEVAVNPAVAPSGPTPTAPAPAASSAPPSNGLAGAPAPARAPGLSLGLGAWAGADVGSIGPLSAGFGAVGALFYRRQRFELGFGFWPERSSTLADRPSTGGDVSLVAISAGTCRAIPAGPISLSPCGSLEVGRLSAAGFGVERPGSGAAAWVALKAGGMAIWEPWDRVGLTLRLEAVAPFVRPRFILENVGTVHRPSAVASRAAAGVEVRF
jgi:hypothetical protein